MAENKNGSGCGCLGVFIAVALSAWICWSFGPGLAVVLVASVVAYIAIKAS